MPRVKEIRAEIGTTGYSATIHVDTSISSAIVDAIGEEHPCKDSTCDIYASLEEGYPLASAYLLTGATETPLLDATIRALEFNGNEFDLITSAGGFDEWCKRFQELRRAGSMRECPCGSFTYCPNQPPDFCENCHAGFGGLFGMKVSRKRGGIRARIERKLA